MILKSLQAGRAFAALVVVVHHAAQGAEAFVGAGPAWGNALAELGYLGVDFFFVLSGFIIFYTSQERTVDVPRFLLRRLIRVFVPYLPIALGLIALYLTLPSLSAGAREWGWLPSLTLLPSHEAPALSVAWTLQHELVFYLLFAALIFVRRVAVGLWLWSTMIVLAWVFDLNGDRPLSILLGQINLEFGMGVLGAMAVSRKWPVPSMALIGAVAVFVVAFVAFGADRSLSVLIGAAVACLLVPICWAERDGSLRVAETLVVLGNASYAIYLIHNPLISVVSRAVGGVSDSWWLAMAVSLGASIGCGLAYHFIYERPALKWVGGLGRHRLRAA